MRRISLLLAVLALAACSQRDETPKARLADTFKDVPVPPGAEGVGRQSGSDAVQLLFRTRLAPTEVADYYRESLKRDPWRLISETRMPDGTLTFYAEQNGPPLWVSIRPDSTTGGSYVDLAGAKAN
jgi:hypothetical protein